LTLHANAANVNEKVPQRCATSLGTENDKKVLFGADDENEMFGTDIDGEQ
jgi:hypothetical protein